MPDKCAYLAFLARRQVDVTNIWPISVGVVAECCAPQLRAVQDVGLNNHRIGAFSVSRGTCRCRLRGWRDPRPRSFSRDRRAVKDTSMAGGGARCQQACARRPQNQPNRARGGSASACRRAVPAGYGSRYASARRLFSWIGRQPWGLPFAGRGALPTSGAVSGPAGLLPFAGAAGLTSRPCQNSHREAPYRPLGRSRHPKPADVRRGLPRLSAGEPPLKRSEVWAGRITPFPELGEA